MFHWQILAGLVYKMAEILILGDGTAGWMGEIAALGGRVIGTCAVFYILFLCRMLGAGDIKLMALCTGILGMGKGTVVIFMGLCLAAAQAAAILYSEGILWERMSRLCRFAISSGRDGKLREYPGRREEKSLLHLGPYLFAGYCLWLICNCLA